MGVECYGHHGRLQLMGKTNINKRGRIRWPADREPGSMRHAPIELAVLLLFGGSQTNKTVPRECSERELTRCVQSMNVLKRAGWGTRNQLFVCHF